MLTKKTSHRRKGIERHCNDCRTVVTNQNSDDDGNYPDDQAIEGAALLGTEASQERRNEKDGDPKRYDNVEAAVNQPWIRLEIYKQHDSNRRRECKCAAECDDLGSKWHERRLPD